MQQTLKLVDKKPNRGKDKGKGKSTGETFSKLWNYITRMPKYIDYKIQYTVWESHTTHDCKWAKVGRTHYTNGYPYSP